MSSQAEHEKLYERIGPADQIQYREYKLLLKADRFESENSFHKFWKIAHHTAKSVGGSLGKMDKKPSAHVREVVFYDTPHFKLYGAGFILRKRTFYKHGEPISKHELVLKFRHPDKTTAASIDVRPLLPCSNVIKFKEEILLPKDDAIGMRTVYSHNCELDTPNIMLTQKVETIADAFPALKNIGANPNATMRSVHDASIAEYLFDTGELDFGGKLAAKSNVAVWRLRETDEPLVAEFAFQLRFERPEMMHHRARELSEFFYTGLQTHAGEWIQRGTTKTALIYGLGNTNVEHSE